MLEYSGVRISGNIRFKGIKKIKLDKGRGFNFELLMQVLDYTITCVQRVQVVGALFFV